MSLKPHTLQVLARIKTYLNLVKEEEFRTIHCMTNVSDRRTHLPGGIWLWVSPQAGAGQHSPRIKVSKLRGKSGNNDSDWFCVSISDSPRIVAGTNDKYTTKEIRAIYAWVVLNKDTLITIWNSTDLDSGEIANMLKPLP